MADTQEVRPKHCRIYQNGDAMSIHINKELTNEIDGRFPPMHDYSAVFDPEKETLTIFKPKLP